ncbi:Asp23/Gls24 family envelope stress response protein [Clostridium massiliamazoniense]|uniref:Asp23/Gls24 family envelope stress response protein n=1 Tax=Clostridium massiliamazoniense TaxID=1347366 RepID=UPI0006D76C42|nr:Asp23/Gls24 family envelope stress response protein [Clostridium massiliamazoniense]
MDELNKDNANLGIVKISDEVISVIAAIAASEVDGIFDQESMAKGLTQKLKGKKHLGKSVKVSMEDEEAIIDIAITVQYGVKIPDIVSQVQDNVKRTVEAITGLKVRTVNVLVQNIIVLKEEENNEIDNK